MNSVMETKAMNTVAETVQVYRGKRQAKIIKWLPEELSLQGQYTAFKMLCSPREKRCIISVQLCIVQLTLWTWLGEQLMKSAHLHHLQDLRSLDHPCTAHELKNCLQPCHILSALASHLTTLCTLINLVLGPKEITTSV